MTHESLVKRIRVYIKAFAIAPEKINNGSCGLFAELVINSLGGETEDLYSSFTDSISPAHEWITFNDRHYDAEAIEGVDSHELLPWFKRQFAMK